MQTVCTIITADYLPMAKVLLASLEQQLPGTTLQVLVVDNDTIPSSGNLQVHPVAALAESNYFKGIFQKYGQTSPDYYRWALKPVFIGYLLEKGFNKVLFADPDLYFVGDFRFLFDELDEQHVLLTPHWANLDPIQNEDSLLAVLKGGMFNAGFVGVSSKGAGAMQWWAGLCHYKTEDLTGLGLFVDQKYLDLLPVQFENVKVIKHRGCNLASWNIDTSRRELVSGKLLINGEYPPVFIHFAKDTIVNILNQNDSLLRPYWDAYQQALQKEGFDLTGRMADLDPKQYESAGYQLKHRLLFRTRLKRFFHRIAKKL